MPNTLVFILNFLLNFFILLFSCWISQIFNVTNFIHFIPEDKKFEISVSLYTAIILVIVNLIKEFINDKKTNIKLIAYGKKQDPNMKNIPEFQFSTKYGVSEIHIDIHIRGNLKIINKLILSLDFPNWVQPQFQSSFIENGSFKIKFKDIIGVSRSDGRLEEKKITLEIPIICNPGSLSQEDSVVFKIEEKTWFFCTFEKNSFKLKNKK